MDKEKIFFKQRIAIALSAWMTKDYLWEANATVYEHSKQLL